MLHSSIIIFLHVERRSEPSLRFFQKHIFSSTRLLALPFLIFAEPQRSRVLGRW